MDTNFDLVIVQNTPPILGSVAALPTGTGISRSTKVLIAQP